MIISNAPKRKPINDNRHDQILWDTNWQYLELWFKQKNVPHDGVSFNFKRSLHYMYEFMNRPWVPIDNRREDALFWFLGEAQKHGHSIEQTIYKPNS